MLDTKKVKSAYEQMYDKELEEFAINRISMLSDEARQILYDEFVKRNLDTSFIDNYFHEIKAEKENEVSGLTNPYMYTFWEFAVSELNVGKSKEEVHASLIAKDLNEERIEQIFLRIPKKLDMNDSKFINMVRSRIQSHTYDSGFQFFILIGLGIVLTFFGLKTIFIPIAIIGIAIICWSAYLLNSRYKGEIKGPDFWIEFFKEKPESFVWIKPILHKTSLYYVITISKINKFQLLTDDGYRATFSCNSEAEQTIFFDGVKKYLPHVHIGYSPEIDSIYEESPKDFIKKIEKQGFYKPIDAFILGKSA